MLCTYTKYLLKHKLVWSSLYCTTAAKYRYAYEQSQQHLPKSNKADVQKVSNTTVHAIAGKVMAYFVWYTICSVVLV